MFNIVSGGVGFVQSHRGASPARRGAGHAPGSGADPGPGERAHPGAGGGPAEGAGRVPVPAEFRLTAAVHGEAGDEQGGQARRQAEVAQGQEEIKQKMSNTSLGG